LGGKGDAVSPPVSFSGNPPLKRSGSPNKGSKLKLSTEEEKGKEEINSLAAEHFPQIYGPVFTFTCEQRGKPKLLDREYEKGRRAVFGAGERKDGYYGPLGPPKACNPRQGSIRFRCLRKVFRK